ncbi:MAG: LysR substrate-binding domain-containing protein [Acetobacteraceae bacterium]
MTVNLTLLRAFHRVAQAGGFTAAARAAAVSQPTLSAQVRALEAGYGVSLFDRRGRHIQLTPLGQRLLGISARLFAAEAEVRDLLGDAAVLAHGQLRVAADSPTHVMPLLAALKQRHAGLVFSLRTGNSSDVIRRVLEYECDVGVMAKPVSDPRLHVLPIRDDRLVVFVPVHHRFARRRTLGMAELAGSDLVLRERGSITREVFEARLADRAILPGRLLEVETREAVREAVLAGFGVGVVFESELGHDPATRSLEVRDADLAVTEYLICLEERRRLPLVESLFAIVRASIAERDGTSAVSHS